MGKAVGYNMSSFANSPVNGLLYVRGTLGEAAHPPLLRLTAAAVHLVPAFSLEDALEGKVQQGDP